MPAKLFREKAMPETQETFHFEINKSTDAATGAAATTFVCHGRLTSQTGAQLKDAVKPLIGQGGRIVLDLGDVNYVDSSGLGVLVGLKASALHAGYCRLLLENLTPRVQDLLNLTNLIGLFKS